MAKTPALTMLQKESVPHTVREYDHDAAQAEHLGGYGLEAAQALGVDPARVFKTLVCEVDSRLVVAITPVTGKLDVKAVAHAVGGKKAAMADPADAQRATGYVVGGISPLGQKKRLATVLDASASEFSTVLVSAGRRGLDVELAPADLARLTGAVIAPIGA